MTGPQTPNPLIRVPLIFARASGATAVPGYVYPLANVWLASWDSIATNDRAIRGYNIAGPPGSQVDFWFENNLDDSTTQMGTATQQEYTEPHILYRGITLYVVIQRYMGRFHFSVADPPIGNLFYHNDVKGGY